MPPGGRPGRRRPRGRPGSSDRLDLWLAAVEAVAAAGRRRRGPGEELPPAGAPPRGLGATPPGLVLSSPDSPMLAGAVALAAGRFQPLVRLEPALVGARRLGRSSGPSDMGTS